MNHRIRTYQVVGVLVIFAITLITAPAEYGNSSVLLSSSRNYPSQDWNYTPSENIVISSDENMLNAGFPGSGSSSDPFRISRLVITTLTTGIVIDTVSYHFMIEDCIIRSPTTIWDAFDGIIIEDSPHGQIVNNTIKWKNTGIRAYECDSVRIENNTIENCWVEGISIAWSDGARVANNVLENITSDGISTRYCEEIVITSNTISECQGEPVSVRNCQNSRIEKNSITGSQAGIAIEIVQNMMVVNNTMEQGGIRVKSIHTDPSITWFGNYVGGQEIGYFEDNEKLLIDGAAYGQIIMVNCTRIRIVGGIVNNVSQGILADDCNDCILENIKLQDIWQVGIELQSCQNMSIVNCSLFGPASYNLKITASIDTMIVDCIIAEGEYGVYLSGGENCSISRCRIQEQREVGVFSYSDGLALNSSIFRWNLQGGLEIHQNPWEKNIAVLSNNQFYNDGLSPNNEILPDKMVLHNNTVNGKDLEIIIGETDRELDAYLIGQLFMIQCVRVNIKFGFFLNTTVGLLADDCSDCSISNCGFAYNRFEGILIRQGSGMRISNCTLDENEIGLRVSYSSTTTVRDCTARNNSLAGISFDRSSDYTIASNNFIDCGLKLDRISAPTSTNAVFGNVVNGKSLFSLFGTNNINLDLSRAGQIILTQCRNLTIEGLILRNSMGLQLFDCSNCTIRGMTIEYHRGGGVYLSGCRNIMVEDCLLRYNRRFAIKVFASEDCIIRNSTMAHNEGEGIGIYSSNSIEVASNFIDYNGGSGIHLEVVEGYSITGNEILYNDQYGIIVEWIYSLPNEGGVVVENAFGWNKVGNALLPTLPSSYLSQSNILSASGNYWSDFDNEVVYPIPAANYTDLAAKPLRNKTQFLPEILSHSIDYDFRGLTATITWNTTDDNPEYFEVYVDGELYFTNQWSQGQLAIKLEDLSMGTHQVILILYDTVRDSNSDVVMIQVRPRPFSWLYSYEGLLFIGFALLQIVIVFFIWQSKREERKTTIGFQSLFR